MAITNNFIFQKITNSKLLKKAGTVFTGSVLAQGLILGTAPILSRLYEVSQFGEMGFFMLVGMFGTQLFNWRLDFGIISSKNQEDAKKLVSACLWASIISAFLMLLLLTFLNLSISKKAGFEFKIYIIPVVAYSASYAIWNNISFYNIKELKYKKNAKFSIIRALITVIISIGFYNWKSFNGLIAGLLIGQTVTSVWLLLSTFPSNYHSFWNYGNFSFKIFKKTVSQNRGLIQYSLPSAATELLAGQLPQYFIGGFGSTVFGWFSQANRLLNAPLDLIGQSFRSVFWESAGREFNNSGNCRILFYKTVLLLILSSILPFTLIYWFSTELFVWFLGDGWEQAGIYAKWLIPMCFFRFVSNPVSSLFYITNKQKIDFFIQFLFVVLIICVFFFPGVGIKKSETAIIIYSILYSLKYILELVYSWIFALGK